jgi:hypothetical protein
MLQLLILNSFGLCVPRFILVIKVNKGQEPLSFCIIKQTPHMEEEVYLLPSVDQFLRRICNEKNQAWPDAEARRELASLSEELAHKKVLQIIYDSREIKTLGGFIKHLVLKCSSPSPAKTIRTSYFQSPSAISSSTPHQLVHFSSAGS